MCYNWPSSRVHIFSRSIFTSLHLHTSGSKKIKIKENFKKINIYNSLQVLVQYFVEVSYYTMVFFKKAPYIEANRKWITEAPRFHLVARKNNYGVSVYYSIKERSVFALLTSVEIQGNSIYF